MDLSEKVVKDIEEALDELRDSFVNRDYRRADKLKKTLLNFLEPIGYTLAEDTKKVYVLKKISNQSVN